jgi:hypothetical protein
MPDGGDLSISGRTNADALDGGGAVHGIVEHQGPRQRHLYRPSGRARAKRREYRIGAHPQLAAEAAANERRDKADILLRNAERRRHVGSAPVDHLV